MSRVVFWEHDGGVKKNLLAPSGFDNQEERWCRLPDKHLDTK
jgi:hypothetical protein